jgi:DNA-binding CsgD family transcriptional regulator
LHDLGHLAVAEGDVVRACRLLHRGLTLTGEIGDQRRQALTLLVVAALAADEGDAERAVSLETVATATLRKLDVAQGRAMRATYEAHLEPARRLLGEVGVWAAEARGRATTLEAAVAEALAWLAAAVTLPEPADRPSPACATTPDDPANDRAIDERPPPAAALVPPSAPVDPASALPLTRRELDVARLIALGMTNRQIAAALVITEGTTSNYVQRVMSRLGFHSRAQVAAWVAERGLQEPASDQDG